MRSPVPAFLLALAACASGPDTALRAPTPDLIDNLEAQTVALVVKLDPLEAMLEGSDARSFCTGVWVTETLVLTAKHCTVKTGFSVATKQQVMDGVRVRQHIESFSATVVGVDGAHDLALVQVDNPPPHPVATVAAAPAKGEHVMTMGHAMGLWWSFSSGEVAAVRELDDGFITCNVVQTTAPTSAGNSGGGLFNTKGELVGVAHATLTRGQNLNFYIHPQYISAFLPRRSVL